MVASQFGTGQVFWSMLWVAVLFIWVWLLIAVVADIFRSHDLSGLGKFLWLVLVVFAPYLGVFVYFIARGHKMHEHAAEDIAADQVAAKAYVRQAAIAAPPTMAGELERLADLRDNGVISPQEFEARKAKLLDS